MFVLIVPRTAYVSRELMLADITADLSAEPVRYPERIGGMRHFALSKMGITRAVMTFRQGAAEPSPLTLVFHFPKTYLTHRHILDSIRAKVTSLDQVYYKSYQS